MERTFCSPREKKKHNVLGKKVKNRRGEGKRTISERDEVLY